MGLRISTNIASLNAQRNLQATDKRYTHSLAALSSGSRIVSAADDAAGLAISENIRGQTRGIAQAKSNANNAISLVQTGEGGLNEVNNIGVDETAVDYIELDDIELTTILKWMILPPPLTGRKEAAAAERTPGSVLARSTRRSKNW